MLAFTRLLRQRGHELVLFDLDEALAVKVAGEHGCVVIDSIKELIESSETIIICTPMNTIPGIIEEVSAKTEKMINLVEISSIKNKAVAELGRNLESIRPVSVHPMFGPDVDGFEGKTIVLVPVVDRSSEEEVARRLFPGAKIVVLDSETHDRSMALILSLPYFMNSGFMKCVSQEDLSLLKEIAGPTFRTQVALAQCILSEDPLLVESLIEDNVYAGDVLTRYIDELKYLRRMLKTRPRKLVEYYEENLEDVKKDPDFSNARNLRNLFLQSSE